LSSKWLNINEEVAYKKTMNCTNIAELRIGKYLYKIRCTWQNNISNILLDVWKGGSRIIVIKYVCLLHSSAIRYRCIRAVGRTHSVFGGAQSFVSENSINNLI
jgi:hypothetical protein